jgi:glyceraldehyde 3-phosphate dehydrogenase
MNKIRIGINGFGRIGRSLARVIMEREDLELVAINDLADAPTLVHLLKYDSIHGRFPASIGLENDSLLINNGAISITHEEKPENINWSASRVDLVIEATGKFKTKETAKNHLKEGVKKVVISAPATDDTKMVVIGVNDDLLNDDDDILSNASCTTNCAAPMVDLIMKNFGVESAYVTTVHSFTTDQKLHDAPHRDLRRARAATLSMVPTTTGAAKALSHIFPMLDGHLGGCGIRVPVPDGSLTDITFHVQRDTSVAEVNNLFKAASENELKGILGYTEEPLVSADIIGMKESCLIDGQLTSVLGKMVKIVGWYDNEMGYSNRLADLATKLFNPVKS